ncbi:MAG: hypothetical protein MZW92_07225 [Comamonadaceae bacterium]|nr:hypothetical protein [Comamonadaceae bacterium]
MHFLKGEIEHIPLPDDIGRRDHLELRHQPVGRQGPRAAARRSGCSSPAAASRVSDVVVRGEVPPAIRGNMELWVGCVAGALSDARLPGQARTPPASRTPASRSRASTAPKTRRSSWPGRPRTCRNSRVRSTASSRAGSSGRRSRWAPRLRCRPPKQRAAPAASCCGSARLLTPATPRERSVQPWRRIGEPSTLGQAPFACVAARLERARGGAARLPAPPARRRCRRRRPAAGRPSSRRCAPAPGFCRLDDPRAWLFRVARNALTDRLRLTRPQEPLTDALADTLVAVEPEPHAAGRRPDRLRRARAAGTAARRRRHACAPATWTA